MAKSIKKAVKKKVRFQHPHILLTEAQKGLLEGVMVKLRSREDAEAKTSRRKAVVITRMDAFQHVYDMYKKYELILVTMKGKKRATGS